MSTADGQLLVAALVAAGHALSWMDRRRLGKAVRSEMDSVRDTVTHSEVTDR